MSQNDQDRDQERIAEPGRAGQGGQTQFPSGGRERENEGQDLQQGMNQGGQGGETPTEARSFEGAQGDPAEGKRELAGTEGDDDETLQKARAGQGEEGEFAEDGGAKFDEGQSAKGGQDSQSKTSGV